MAEQSNLKRQDRIRLCGIGIGLVAAILTCEVPEQSQWAGWDIERAVRNPSFGSGSGSPGRLRGKRKGTSLKPVNLWERIRQNQDDKRLQDLIHLSVSQFEGLLLKFKEENFPEKFESLACKIVFEDKVLLFFQWLVQYPQYSTLAMTYGISVPVISRFLSTSLSHFVGFFSPFVPNFFSADCPVSHLSPHVIGIVDGTVHKIRRPSIDQHLWWNDNYQFHAVHSLFLVDFAGKIIAIQTGIPGSFHDSAVARHNELFSDSLQDQLAIGDPGFGGVDYIVAGYKTNQLNYPGRREFDRISRSEQVKIEHVNNFVKKCRCLSKGHTFVHKHDQLSGLVLVAAGWYNYMRETHDKYLCA